MRIVRTATAVCVVSLIAARAGAQGRAVSGEALDAARVIALARQQAPAVRIASARIGEARGRLAGARVSSVGNPVIEGTAGPRWNGETSLDVEAELVVPIALGRRSRRISEAEAGVRREELDLADQRRRTTGEALRAYYGALHAEECLQVALRRRALSEDLRRIALDRQGAGDTSQFEVNLAEIELARSQSEAHAAQAGVARARAALAIVLGLPSGDALRLDGALRDRAALDAAIAGHTEAVRPDVRALRAEAARARAEGALARSAAIPEVSLVARYGREEEANVVLGGIAISLPVFDSGQGPASEASARRRSAELEAQVRVRAAAVEVEGARAAYRAAVEAAGRLDTDGVRRAVESEAMALEAFRTGRLDLPGLIVIRRDVLDTHRDHVDRLLDVAVAAVDLAVALGALP